MHQTSAVARVVLALVAFLCGLVVGRPAHAWVFTANQAVIGSRAARS